MLRHNILWMHLVHFLLYVFFLVAYAWSQATSNVILRRWSHVFLYSIVECDKYAYYLLCWLTSESYSSSKRRNGSDDGVQYSDLLDFLDFVDVSIIRRTKSKKPSNSQFLWVFLIMERPKFFLSSVFSLYCEHSSAQWCCRNTFCSSSNCIRVIRWSVESSVFWDITLCSSLKVNGRFTATCYLHLQSRRIYHEAGSIQSSCLAYSSTLKMKETCSSETLVDFIRTIRRCIPEDRTLHNSRCENLKSYKMKYEIVGTWHTWEDVTVSHRTLIGIPNEATWRIIFLDDSVILKWILKNWSWGSGEDLTDSVYDPIASFCEHENEYQSIQSTQRSARYTQSSKTTHQRIA
jgi:hypothetical protein